MAYRFTEDEPVEAGLWRIAHEQIDKALGELSDPDLGPHESIHQVRKRCKKLRALLRIVRPHLGETYAAENARFRDAARTLSALRDATALIETYDVLVEHYAEQIDRSAFGPVRRALTVRRNQLATEDVDLEARMAAFSQELQAAQPETWTLPAEGVEALREGLAKTYRRGRRAMAAAYENPTAEAFHEWRKRVKYHWYHCRLLRPTWKPVMRARCHALSDLSDLLGIEHDLAVFQQVLMDEPERFGGVRSLQAFLGLIDRRRAELQARAHPLGRRLFAEKPDALVHRLGTYWDAWREEADAQPTLAEPT